MDAQQLHHFWGYRSAANVCARIKDYRHDWRQHAASSCRPNLQICCQERLTASCKHIFLDLMKIRHRNCNNRWLRNTRCARIVHQYESLSADKSPRWRCGGRKATCSLATNIPKYSPGKVYFGAQFHQRLLHFCLDSSIMTSWSPLTVPFSIKRSATAVSEAPELLQHHGSNFHRSRIPSIS